MASVLESSIPQLLLPAALCILKNAVVPELKRRAAQVGETVIPPRLPK
jgi:hypothetical protein